jgi:hypothetical protein
MDQPVTTTFDVDELAMNTAKGRAENWAGGVERATDDMRWWVQRMPAEFRPMAVLWLAEINRHKKLGVSAKATAMLRRQAKHDMAETVDHLKGSPRAVLASWLVWYPAWVKSQSSALVDANPWIWRDAETVATAMKKVKSKKKTNEGVFSELAAVLWGKVIKNNGVLLLDTSSLLADKSVQAVAKRLTKRDIGKAVDDLAYYNVVKPVDSWKSGRKQSWIVAEVLVR